jgi:hypothetical protein
VVKKSNFDRSYLYWVVLGSIEQYWFIFVVFGSIVQYSRCKRTPWSGQWRSLTKLALGPALGRNLRRLRKQQAPVHPYPPPAPYLHHPPPPPQPLEWLVANGFIHNAWSIMCRVFADSNLKPSPWGLPNCTVSQGRVDQDATRWESLPFKFKRPKYFKIRQTLDNHPCRRLRWPCCGSWLVVLPAGRATGRSVTHSVTDHPAAPAGANYIRAGARPSQGVSDFGRRVDTPGANGLESLRWSAFSSKSRAQTLRNSQAQSLRL